MFFSFYVVTQTSIYHVRVNENGNPELEKIALNGISSLAVGEKLTAGGLLAIGKNLFFFLPEQYGLGNQLSGYERRPELVNTNYWGPETSAIIALFKNKKDAELCFQQTDLKRADTRWLNNTREVLVEIGDDHPKFVIARYPDLALLPD